MSGGLPQTGTITVLLRQARDGDVVARDAVFEQAYPEMRRIARLYLLGSGRAFSESSTGMVHRVCETLLAREHLEANDRRHFFRLFGRILHNIMIDELRASLADKRGGGKLQRRDLEGQAAPDEARGLELVDLRDAIGELREHDADAAEVINLRFLCGQTLEEAAETMEITFAVVRRHEDYGKAWLRARLDR